MTGGYFITGTDTDIGKTWSTLALMKRLQGQGLSVVGMKPVAAGCVWQDGGWRNQDALLLQAHSSIPLPYEVINPYAFQAAISPHLASQGTTVSTAKICALMSETAEQGDLVLLEGAGGWYSPISADSSNAGLALSLKLPVILVVGMRLGCINHALLSYRAIISTGLPCAGWIAVAIDANMACRDENIAYLQAHIQAPLLGELPHLKQPDFQYLANCLNTPHGV